MPFIGTFLEADGHLKFDRTDPESRLRQADEMEEFLRNGESVFVFPEGTFTQRGTACGRSSLARSRPRWRRARRSSVSLPGLAGFCAMALICLGRQCHHHAVAANLSTHCGKHK